MFALAALVCTLAGTRLAAAHTSLTYPPPRTDSNKIGPCGADGSTRTSTVTEFRPGETITVTWDEYIDHPGHFRIAFDDDGNDDFPLPNNPDDDFPSVLVDQIPDRQGGGLYEQQVTLPNIECDNCTLQLIQIMTTQVPYNSFYFQCADITLSADASGSADGGPGDPPEPDGSCAAAGGGCPAMAMLLLGVLVALRRRKTLRGPR